MEYKSSNILIFVLTFPMIAQALKCYQCVSTTSTYCEPSRQSIVQCPENMRYCATTSLVTEDAKLATRACTETTNGIGVACNSNKAFNIAGSQCFCTEDLCNGNRGNHFTILSVTFYSLLTLLSLFIV